MRSAGKAREDDDIMDTQGENKLFEVRLSGMSIENLLNELIYRGVENHGNPNRSGELIRVYGELSQRQRGIGYGCRQFEG